MNNIRNALSATQSFDELNKIANQAEPILSSWGTKSISIKGYEGLLPIDAITKKALELLLKSPGYLIEHNNIHLMTRSSLKHGIDRIYDKSDEQVRTANCFTQVLCKIRSYRLLHPNCTPLRWIWREIETENANRIYFDHSFLRSLRYAITKQHFDAIGELTLYADNNPDYSFWRQLREDFYWKIGCLFC